VFIFVFTCRLYILQQGVFELDSIAQQKTSGAAKGYLRASQGGIYPPWSLMLSHIFARGLFSFEVGHWVTKCEISGLKKPTNVFHPKSGHDCSKACTYLVGENPSSTGSVSVVGSIRQIRSTTIRATGIIELHEA
jgi:hypothetical protein